MPGLRTVRRRVHELLRVGEEADTAARWVNGAIVTLILLSVLALILGTVEPLAAGYGDLLGAFEVLSVALFTVEYLARLWSAPEDPSYAHPLGGRLRWSVTPLALVDLLAVLPFYLPMVATLDGRSLRVLRLFRMVRVLKVARYSRSLQTMGRVFRAKRQELTLTLFTVGVLVVVASSLMYFAEHEAQPEAFSSIPETVWWAVITLTTVGYGDVIPVTTAGRILGSVIAVLGIGMIALPAGILGSGFVEEIQKRRDAAEAAAGPLTCPHCGGDVRR